ncbi:GspE/PulE family protein [Lentisphaerota bacterium WC36G]|nr:GspE/PulE family protein [Lentisphaerae bacterium WC36]
MSDLIRWNNQLTAIRQQLLNEFSEYENLLDNYRSLSNADRELTSQGLISEHELLKVYTSYLDVEVLDEDELEYPDQFESISKQSMDLHGYIPYSWDDNQLTCLFSTPYDITQICYELEEFFQRKICFKFARHSLIERLISQVYDNNEQEIDSVNLDGDEQQLRALAGEARIIKLVNEMIKQAIEQGASDIHIEPSELELTIRFRIDGLLREYMQLPLSDFPAIASRVKLIAKLNIAESRRPQDGRINFKIGQYDIDLRFSTIPILRGESLVMRLLRKDAMNIDLQKLGIPDDVLKSFEKLISLRQGMILVVGPTGSGKTTTLYSAMMRLNNPDIKIITVEDPVEYQLPGLNQMQMNPQIGLTFADGLRHILRQDPDIILVGEIRDKETAEIAIQAAQTGHLVFSTLHTNDAVGAISRLQDMGVPSFLINSALVGVLSQRLVRCVCPECQGKSLTGIKCKNCSSTGFKGRTGIYELLSVDEKIREAVKQNCSNSEINKIAIDNGMISLVECGMNLVKKEITTEHELARVVTATGG